MIFPKYLYKRVKRNKGMICSKEEFKSPPFNKEKASFEIQQLGKQHLLEYNTVACFHFIDFSVTFYLWQVIQFYQFP